MKLKTHPHMSDVLMLSHEDLDRINDGEELRISALIIRLEKPDQVHELCLNSARGVVDHVSLGEPNLRLTFDGETGKLKSAEVL